jgi:hypothetical protein
VILVAVLVWFAQPTNAQNTREDPRGSIGEHTCGTWHQVRQAAPHQADLLVGQQVLESWVRGYISGLNMHAAAKNIFGKTNPLTGEQIYLWLDKYCRENPLSGISAGTIKLWRTLPDIRLMITK